MVKRYDVWLNENGAPTLGEKDDGRMVPFTDYAKLEAERDALKLANIDLQDWFDAGKSERDALRGVLEEISHDEGRFGLSASDMRALAKQALARTALKDTTK